MKSRLEQKYNILGALDTVCDKYSKFELDFKFSQDLDFEKIVDEFIASKGSLDKDVFYILDTTLEVDDLKKLKHGATVDFGNQTTLEKVGDSHVHNYLYHNDKPLVFGIHVHLEYNETIVPLKNPLVLYEFNKSRYKKVIVKVGESYTTPKGVKHAAIFSKENTIKLKWY